MQPVPELFYQLWCYYDYSSIWVMEGLFRTYDEAIRRITELREDVETPCMPDWAILEVKGWR